MGIKKILVSLDLSQRREIQTEFVGATFVINPQEQRWFLKCLEVSWLGPRVSAELSLLSSRLIEGGKNAGGQKARLHTFMNK